jgi:hypothetical protein
MVEPEPDPVDIEELAALRTSIQQMNMGHVIDGDSLHDRLRDKHSRR